MDSKSFKILGPALLPISITMSCATTTLDINRYRSSDIILPHRSYAKIIVYKGCTTLKIGDKLFNPIWSSDIEFTNHGRIIKISSIKSNNITISGGEISPPIQPEDSISIICDNGLPFFIVNEVMERLK